jgi:hypothetical protein
MGGPGVEETRRVWLRRVSSCERGLETWSRVNERNETV